MNVRQSAPDQAPELTGDVVAALRAGIRGQVLPASDPAFEAAALEVWNKLTPAGRRPGLIVRVADEEDVAVAVGFARAHRLKVAVRGGGHNWANPTLRNGGLLLDLGNLNQVVSIDPTTRRAVLQPIVSNREVQARLNTLGLAYPSGHCPQVKLSGYLLSGGMSWNQGVWGTGVGSVEAIELVTARGERLIADKDRNADLFWAARGAGPGFFGVATRYHLKLYDLPRAIAGSSYFHPLSEAGAVARWLETLASSLPANIELSLFLLGAPPEVAAKCPPTDAGKACLVTATVFADSMEEARAALAPLDDGPAKARCLWSETAKPTDFEGLFDASGALWREGRRSHVDAMFFDASLADMVLAVRDHFLTVPAPEALVLFTIFTGPDVPAPLPDAAFSMSARYYGGPWTQWLRAEDDEAATLWHDQCLRLLTPLATGHYVSESSTIRHPAFIRKSYSETAWNRLQALRQAHDPEGVFFGPLEGLD
ncbi:FAD-binding oxidoreductase [Solidesulfovibrio sp.]|uniref:FAD-binding oxidoreductase n=1 Tax=Solidesulfovibrio sp. TaxID=2910990 RepID=UPI002B1EE930|nr:FAD-binding oxidoreductase [Solidesulfovibrio sp.]MEA4855444.1 FAD-binding oxidoreductase [Solidesulfovibrio sp.]